MTVNVLNNVDCKILKKQGPAFDGYHYRRANKSQVIWRCCENNWAGRIHFDGIEYVKVTNHAHAPNPEEIIPMEFKSIISTGATISHDPSPRIIREALLYINKNMCTLNGQELFHFLYISVNLIKIELFLVFCNFFSCRKHLSGGSTVESSNLWKCKKENHIMIRKVQDQFHFDFWTRLRHSALRSRAQEENSLD